MKKRFNDETGSVLLLCLLITAVLTALALFGLQSADEELKTSAAERREKNNFFNAETGMEFAVSYFQLIYANQTSRDGGVLYTEDSNGVGQSGQVYINSAGNLTVTGLPSGDSDSSLKNMPIQSGAVVLTFMEADPDDSTTYIPTALLEIRAIMVSAPQISELSTKANEVPSQYHLGPAPEGYSNSLFAARNYCITSTALDSNGNTTNSVLQCGVYVAALRSSVTQLKGL